MAFADIHEGDWFVNVTARTGTTGAWDDLMVVQAMLKLIYKYNPYLAARRPIKGEIEVTGKSSKNTSTLISDFQSFIHKKPVGYVDKATGNTKHNFSIFQLNGACVHVLFSLDYAGGDVITYLKTYYPLLGSRLFVVPTVE